MHDLRAIGRGFALPGEFVAAAPLGRGHIHETYLVTYADGGRTRRYVHQRFNRRVFADPQAVMENIERVLAHLQRKLGPADGAERRVLRLIHARDGAPLWRDEAGECWRTYHHIEGSRGVEVADSPRLVREAARAFGAFQRELRDLPPPRLHETIPRFHDTP
ncbi:MAG TPA: hypothetical protein VJS92_09745, partial [Candidatus Polarisedimenticolaceae bacterium]|nr:hypothetical protein [Candidatus Polarisedimenticolaceae bacterium]